MPFSPIYFYIYLSRNSSISTSVPLFAFLSHISWTLYASFAVFLCLSICPSLPIALYLCLCCILSRSHLISYSLSLFRDLWLLNFFLDIYPPPATSLPLSVYLCLPLPLSLCISCSHSFLVHLFLFLSSLKLNTKNYSIFFNYKHLYLTHVEQRLSKYLNC